MRPRLSLKGRGLQLLSQREHSRLELRRKLLAHAKAGVDRAGDPPPEPVDPQTLVDQVEQVLDWLHAQRYLSEERFVESRVHARSARFGNLRIRQELAQHGVALAPDAAQSLKDTELARAREVWQRRFGAPADSAAERARQMRFLAGRGFSGAVIRRAVQGAGDD